MRDCDFKKLGSDCGVAEPLVERNGRLAGVENHVLKASFACDTFALLNQRTSYALRLEVVTDSDLSHLDFTVGEWDKNQTCHQGVVQIGGEMYVRRFGAELLGSEDETEWATKNIVPERNGLQVIGASMMNDSEGEIRHGGESTTSLDARYIGHPIPTRPS